MRRSLSISIGTLLGVWPAIAAAQQAGVELRLDTPVLEAEINPLMIRGAGQGVVAVDALLRLKPR